LKGVEADLKTAKEELENADTLFKTKDDDKVGMSSTPGADKLMPEKFIDDKKKYAALEAAYFQR